MSPVNLLLPWPILTLVSLLLCISCQSNESTDLDALPPHETTTANYSDEINRFLAYEWQPELHELAFFLKQPNGDPYNNFHQLRNHLKKEKKELVFAMNGGMFHKDFSPVGLYIENGKLQQPIVTKKEGDGNFFMQPNGVFYINNNNQPKVCTTEDYPAQDVKFATQSGPMLLINGEINPSFSKTSKHLNIRNGVGILPNGHALFCISTEEVTFYEMASFFKEKGCEDALYLDGFISAVYCPEKGKTSNGGPFGVLIGIYH